MQMSSRVGGEFRRLEQFQKPKACSQVTTSPVCVFREAAPRFQNFIEATSINDDVIWLSPDVSGSHWNAADLNDRTLTAGI